MANYTVNHIKQIIIIGEKVLSHQEDIEIADLVSRGYKVKQQAKRTSTKGMKGFANAKKWAKEQHNIK